jgi:hypothetical protein
MSMNLCAAPSRRRVLAGAALLWAVAATAWASPPINTLKGGPLGGRADLAILGYDAVGYFSEGKPVPGDPKHVHEWMGARWRFASASNLGLFKANPVKYAPQYGGYCAYGVSQGHLVGIEPDKFKILDGKLYLNYDADVQATWLKDPAGYVRQADARFKALLKQ